MLLQLGLMAELRPEGLALWRAGKLDIDHFNQTGEILSLDAPNPKSQVETKPGIKDTGFLELIRSYYNSLCFLDQCLPTRSFSINHLAKACNVSEVSSMRELLHQLIKEDQVLEAINFERLKTVKWCANDSNRFDELILKVRKGITKSRINYLISSVSSQTPLAQISTISSTEAALEEIDRDLNTKLPRKHQVKVLLNDIESKYLESLIGVIGDDKSSVFRNLLHVNFQQRTATEASLQRQSSDQVQEKNSEEFNESVEVEFLYNSLAKQLTEVSSTLIARGISRENQQFVSGTEEELLEWVKLAAKSNEIKSLTFYGKANDNPLINTMHAHIKGIKLIYEGSIHERIDHASSDYTSFIFDPE